MLRHEIESAGSNGVHPIERPHRPLGVLRCRRAKRPSCRLAHVPAPPRHGRCLPYLNAERLPGGTVSLHAWDPGLVSVQRVFSTGGWTEAAREAGRAEEPADDICLELVSNGRHGDRIIYSSQPSGMMSAALPLREGNRDLMQQARAHVTSVVHIKGCLSFFVGKSLC